MRLKARSFRQLLSVEEVADWREFVVQKLHSTQAPWLTLPVLVQRVQALQAQSLNESTAVSERRSRLLDVLAEHASMLMQRYPA